MLYIACMYAYLLPLHSLFRWLVLLGLVVGLISSYRGWLGQKAYTALDNGIRHWSATIAHVQLVLGLWLYFVSPLTNHFIHHFSEDVHDRQIRFFGMEHSIMMIVGIVIMTVASMMAKRQKTDTGKFRVLGIGYTIALLVILSSIPWPFSPMVSRPYIRLI